MLRKDRVKKITEILKKEHPNAKTELNHTNERELAIAVALSAQTTDKKVNEITAKLFKKYNSWEGFATADLKQLQEDIRGVNFHLGKASRIIKMAQKVLTDFNGSLPRNLKGLTTLPGIARKSANAILNEAWGLAEGIVVDTHVTRVSNRLELTDESKNAVKIEKDLMQVIPKEHWRNFSQACVLHGRYICIARKPKCAKCALSELCPSAFSFD